MAELAEMIIFTAEQEELALRCLSDQILDGPATAWRMMNTAKYCSDRGFPVPVVTESVAGKRTGVVYDGYWAVG